MPTADQFTPAFVGAFIERCHQRGLTKEATASLLQTTATVAAHNNPGFAAGFRESLVTDGMEKYAANYGKWLGRGLSTNYGKWLGRGLAAVGAGTIGAGTIGAGLYGVNRARDYWHHHNRAGWSDIPVFGDVSENDAANVYKQRLGKLTEGISRANSAVEAEGKKIAELQAIYEAGGAGSAEALTQLQALRNTPARKQWEAYKGDLDRYYDSTRGNLPTVQRDIEDLNKDRNSWFYKARNKLNIFPRDFDAEERRLAGQRESWQTHEKLLETARARLASGATSFTNPNITYPQVQEELFPKEK